MTDIDVKLNTAHEIGCRLDDMLENSNKDLYRAAGAIEALKQMLTVLEDLPKVIDKDLDDGQFELDVAAIAKSYIIRAQTAAKGMLSNSETNKMLMQGRINAMSQAVRMVKEFGDAEKRRDDAMKAAYDQALKRAREEIEKVQDAQADEQRKIGERPSSSLKMKRLAESLPKDPSEEPNAEEEIVKGDEVAGEEKQKPLSRSKKEKK